MGLGRARTPGAHRRCATDGRTPVPRSGTDAARAEGTALEKAFENVHKVYVPSAV